MLEQLAPLIAQAPYLVAFIWFALEINKGQKAEHTQFLEALDRKDKAFEQMVNSLIKKMDEDNARISEAIEILCRAQTEHDRFVREHMGGGKKQEKRVDEDQKTI